ncbi:3-isopropylmalate dehydratase small subunit [Gordonia sp. HNM0687]|uniref:3-isopropylmalate dehydratase small subunit n=2 Tax=Gordonia TaxID=2053 RepID=A0A6L7GVD4_9ACTN|nr:MULTISPECIES: 3-isopropylmalate dehydratase small subunit [Gordonia]MCX2963202.1 3-isopropylmalate dehydratase small subunit [Gordonia aquimaris]MXP23850.1 3-isopropylmalate dehydratase small subunit [Gordonia mangrovi]UVF76407.1 3-isopropylmalate dehydratase small subunit [Gordonia mangrovi]
MKPIPFHRGTAIAVNRTSIDTDIIIPAKHCLRVTRSGFADHLFEGWRSDPNFALNDDRRREATVLVAGRDFGTGSSREAAVWALQEWGFQVIVSSRFGDIFYTNCGNNGVVAARIDDAPLHDLMSAVLDRPDTTVSIDLPTKTLEWRDGHVRHQTLIDIDDFTSRRLIEGLDDIDITLQRDSEITTYEHANSRYLPRKATVA